MIVLSLGIALHYFGGKPFSPGPLSAASPRNTPLSGYATHAEFASECGWCHTPWRGATADRCQACHAHESEQQLRSTGLHGRLPDTRRCGQCHTEHQGAMADITHYELNQFEHDWLTAFSLAKHTPGDLEQPVECQDCHPGKVFDATTVACLACHETISEYDLRQHIALFGVECVACHDGIDSMAAYDHSEVFPLVGAHTDLACAACHVASSLRDTDHACNACHTEPVVHAGAFGLACDRCHTANGWLPAQLIAHTFPLDHGEEGKIACQVCHTITYVEHTCTNCHAHPEEEVRAQHVDEGILDFGNCIECHPTGEEDGHR